MLEAKLRLERESFVLDTDLQAPAGAVTVVFGPSGCGKTLLLHCLAGLIRGQGYCRLGESWWQDDGRQHFVPTHRRGVGIVFQDARLFDHLSVAANLRYAARRGGTPWPSPHEIEWLALEGLLSRRPITLSGGERQRVAIARTLLSRPRLLLLDEPLASLDAARKEDILPYLERLVTELAVPMIYVTHSLPELIRLGDRVVLMDNGHTLESGPVWEILTRLDLPLARREDASTLLEAVVLGHNERFHLTELGLGGIPLRVPQLSLPGGQRVRLRVQARDVSITLEAPQHTSILNVLPARVTEVVPDSEGQRLVRLTVGEQTVLARISALSQHHLRLEPGAAVYAQIKSMALV